MTETTPAALTFTLPVKPTDADTVTLLTEPLSAGGADGVTVADAPGMSAVAEYAPSAGAVFAVTLTVKLAVDMRLWPSVTETVMLFAPTVAEQSAAMLAVTLPLLFVSPETLRPAGTLDAATIRLPAGVASSLTVAMGETPPALPCCRATAAAGVMDGEPLMLSAKFVLAVAPQLSVAVTVTV